MKDKLQEKLDKNWKRVKKHAKKARKYFSVPITHMPAELTAYYDVRNIRKHYG